MDLLIKAQAAEKLLNIISGKEHSNSNKFILQKPLCPLSLKRDLKSENINKSGLKISEINNMLKEMEETEEANIHSIVIIKDNKLILEKSFYPFKSDIWHVTHSASKTLTALAIGILVTRNLISTETKLADIFDTEMNFVSKFKLGKIKLSHILTMTSGISVNETVTVTEGDWLKATFDSNLNFEPGSKFQYNSINSYLLSAITQKITGKTLFDFLKENLFNRLGIENVHWDACPMGRTKGGFGLYMSTYDMAKIGNFILNSGKINGELVIKKEFIDEMISPKVKTEKNMGIDAYGYQVWVNEKYNSFTLNGMLGQNVHCFKDTNTVVAVTGGCSHLFGKCEVNLIINKYFGEGRVYGSEEKIGKIKEKIINKTYKIKGNKFLNGIDIYKKYRINRLLNYVDGKSFSIYDKYLCFSPLFMSVINNSYTESISKISFKKEKEKLILSLNEGDKVNIIPVNFYEFEYFTMDINGEKYECAAMGDFTKNEDGISVLKISVPMLETSSGRIIKIFFKNEGEINIKLTEVPGSKILEEGILSLGTMLQDKGGFSIIKKIDPYLIKRISKSLTEQECEAQRENDVKKI